MRREGAATASKLDRGTYVDGKVTYTTPSSLTQLRSFNRGGNLERLLGLAEQGRAAGGGQKARNYGRKRKSQGQGSDKVAAPELFFSHLLHQYTLIIYLSALFYVLNYGSCADHWVKPIAVFREDCLRWVRV